MQSPAIREHIHCCPACNVEFREKSPQYSGSPSDDHQLTNADPQPGRKRRRHSVAPDVVVIPTKRRRKKTGNEPETKPVAFADDLKNVCVASVQETVWIGIVDRSLVRQAFQKVYPQAKGSEAVLEFLEDCTLIWLLPSRPHMCLWPIILILDKDGNCDHVLWIDWSLAVQLFDLVTKRPSISPTTE